MQQHRQELRQSIVNPLKFPCYPLLSGNKKFPKKERLFPTYRGTAPIVESSCPMGQASNAKRRQKTPHTARLFRPLTFVK